MTSPSPTECSDLCNMCQPGSGYPAQTNCCCGSSNIEACLQQYNIISPPTPDQLQKICAANGITSQDDYIAQRRVLCPSPCPKTTPPTTSNPVGPATCSNVCSYCNTINSPEQLYCCCSTNDVDSCVKSIMLSATPEQIAQVKNKCNSAGWTNKDTYQATLSFNNKCQKCPQYPYELIMADDFDYASQTLANWDLYQGPDPTMSCVTYDPKAILYNNSLITIKPIMPNPIGGLITSGRFSSKQKFLYGYFEARIQLNAMSKFAWPAFWLLADNENLPWPQAGEIDILETCDSAVNKISLQCSPYNPGLDNPTKYINTVTQNSMDYQNFHTYAVNWYPEGDNVVIEYYYDAVMTPNGPVPSTPVFRKVLPGDGSFADCISAARKGQDPFGNKIGTGDGPFTPYQYPMRIMFNLAIGQGVCPDHDQCNPGQCISGPPEKCLAYANSNCACAGFSPDMSFNIDWVRVWQYKGASSSASKEAPRWKGQMGQNQMGQMRQNQMGQKLKDAYKKRHKRSKARAFIWLIFMLLLIGLIITIIYTLLKGSK